MCGDQRSGQFLQPVGVGSSPRVRGPVATAKMGVRKSRFIPACAGTRSSGRLPSLRGTVHPRVCGDQLTKKSEAERADGSSPRVRGPVSIGAHYSTSYTVHPRVCGDQDTNPSLRKSECGSSPRVRGPEARPFQPIDGNGSSPRVRGPVVWQTCSPARLRFIPACAGTSHCLEI